MRWNIENIFYLSHDGRRRDIELDAGRVNIITGASGTGKSAIIKTVDYCLGSSRCELPKYIKRRCVAVGVKWVGLNTELVVGRRIPPGEQKTTNRMFISYGSKVTVPENVDQFAGPTAIDTARRTLERLFGFRGARPDEAESDASTGKISIRHATPYMFVTKETIVSETITLHGLDDKDKVDELIAAIPFFLGAITEESLTAERRLRQLRRALEIELARVRARDGQQSERALRAQSLLREAAQVGLVDQPQSSAPEAVIIRRLQNLVSTESRLTAGIDETELVSLYEQRGSLLAEISSNRRKRQVARATSSSASGFAHAVHTQLHKLSLADHLELESAPSTCPVCEQETQKGQQFARMLKVSLDKLKQENVVIETHRPRLEKHIEELELEGEATRGRLRVLDETIRTFIDRVEDARLTASTADLASRVIGRISYFLETIEGGPPGSDEKLRNLQSEIEQLESISNREATEFRLRWAESEISRFASEILHQLPVVDPCANADLQFVARQADVRVIEDNDKRSVLRLPDIGSDQNYLAIHISLNFALQKHFKNIKAPVPGLLFLDQISRPYFPATDEYDERVLQDDDDTSALQKHINFLFAETERQKDLQVVLLEHAYFAGDKRFVAATKQRWTRSSGEKLIPADWPER